LVRINTAALCRKDELGATRSRKPVQEILRHLTVRNTWALIVAMGIEKQSIRCTWNFQGRKGACDCAGRGVGPNGSDIQSGHSFFQVFSIETLSLSQRILNPHCMILDGSPSQVCDRAGL
jgi:hypothetical protein